MSAYVAKTTLDMSKIIHDHLWLFLNGEGYGARFTGYKEVSHIHKIMLASHQNIIFILKDSRVSTKYKPCTTNCCLPEFLDESVRRSCGASFEALNKNSGFPIIIPESGDLARELEQV